MLMAFAGFPTATNWLLTSCGLTTTSVSGQVTDVSVALSWTAIGLIALAIGVFTLSALGVQINAGIFSMQTTDSKIVATLSGALIVWGCADLISILNVAYGFGIPWIKFVSTLIIFPLIIGWIIAMVQWWRGADI